MFRVDPPHSGTMRTKATSCQVLSAVGPADLLDDVRRARAARMTEMERGISLVGEEIPTLVAMRTKQQVAKCCPPAYAGTTGTGLG